MSNSEPILPSAPASQPGARLRGILGNCALVAGLWLVLIRLPLSPAADLDPSWRMTLGYALEHGWQFGRDLVFTYGPLGFVLAPTNSGGLYGAQLAWQLGVNLAFALSIWGFGRGLTGWRRTVYYIYFFAFGVSYMDAVHMILILLYSLALTRDRILANRWLTGLAAFGLGFLSLVKFTNLLLAGFAVACVLAWQLWRRRNATAGLIGGTFAAAFLGGWAALGQSLTNLPAYLRNSLSISSGYVEAMGLDESGLMLCLGLGAAFTVAGYYALRLVGATDRPRAAATTLIAAAASFLNWKHGFVRADGHVLAHFFICLFIVSSYPVLLQDEPAFRRTKGVLLAACAALSLAGIWAYAPPIIIWAPNALNSRLVENAQALASIGAYPSSARAEFERLGKMYALSGIKVLMREQPVDILGNEQAYALFNDFNFRPRPTLQGYAAYNRQLEQLNADFYASPRAPEFVLQKLDTIDGHLPAIEDALATRYLYHHYRFVMEDQGFVVWKRQAPNLALDQRALVRSEQVSFDQSVIVPEPGDTPLWCEFEIQPSLLGRLRSFFYKPPQLNFAVVDGGGNRVVFRMVRDRAGAGFLVYPHFTSNYNVVKYQDGDPAPRIARLAALMPADQRKYFASRIEVRFYRLPPFPRVMHAAEKPPEIKFRVFNRVPLSASSAVPSEIMPENGREVLFVHAPSKLEFLVVPPTRHLKGHFGFIANAYQNGHATQGSEFIIEWTDDAGNTTRLFSRLLLPATVPADRGQQDFEIDLPPGSGRLAMRTTAGPSNNNAFGWTYWTDVAFSP